jgi:hypothetical protein
LKTKKLKDPLSLSYHPVSHTTSFSKYHFKLHWSDIYSRYRGHIYSLPRFLENSSYAKAAQGNPSIWRLPQIPSHTLPKKLKMPHAISTFFRSHSTSSDLPTDLKKGSRGSSIGRPSLSHRSPSSSGSSLASLEEKERKHGKVMPDSHKRLSFPGLTPKTPSPKSSSRSIVQHHPATLDCVIESPPLVFYGAAASSTGALLSGQIRLNILDEHMAIDKFKMRLALEVTRKKPFHSHCQECSHQSTDLTTWIFLQGPATLAKGERKSKIRRFE